MKYIVYNCGYYNGYTINCPISGRRYRFMKRMVTEVEDEDYKYFLGLNADDIPWCSSNSKTVPPFVSLEDWCNNTNGCFRGKDAIKFIPEEYLKSMLLKQ